METRNNIQDAFSAKKVVQQLKSIAEEKDKTVVTTLHMPRSSIFELIDDLMLLADGKLIYSGSREKVLAYFESLGYSCPVNDNPADFIIDLVSIDLSSEEAQKESIQRLEELAQAWKKTESQMAKQKAQEMPAQCKTEIQMHRCAYTHQVGGILTISKL